MILIISSEPNYSTDKVMKLLAHYRQPVKRIRMPTYSEEIKEWINFILPNQKYLTKTEILRSCWFNCNQFYIKDSFSSDEQIDSTICDHLSTDLNILFNNFYYTNRESIKFLNKPPGSGSKILNLNRAKEAGLKTPKTWIVTRKEQLRVILNNCNVITKAIDKGIRIENEFYISNALRTKRVNVGDLNDFADSFYPCLIQEEIEKDIEIRVIYLNGEVYAGAIFSQSNETTLIDFRNYCSYAPPRIVPFYLPDIVIGKLIVFMKSIEQNFGSIDMIMSKKGEYYFLECNPLGQYEFISEPCNFNIERQIVKFLSNAN